MSDSSSSDSLELALEDDNTPARTGLARAKCERSSSVRDLVQKLSSLGLSITPPALTSTPAKVPIQVPGCQDSQESSSAEDAEGPGTSGLVERLRRKLEERFHTDFTNRGRSRFDDEAVGVILEHVDQPGGSLQANLNELCSMRTPLGNRRGGRSYFVDNPVQAEVGSPCQELYDSTDEENCSLLDRTPTFISTYTCTLKRARRSTNSGMSQHEKTEMVRLSLDQEFRDTVTLNQKERILESCMQRVDDLAVDDEECDANNNDVVKLETPPKQHREVECIILSDSPYVQGTKREVECIILSDSPYVQGTKREARQDPDPRPLEFLGGPSEEVDQLDNSDCLSLYADASFLDLSSELSKEDSSDSDPVEINADFKGSPLMDQTQPDQTSTDPEMIRDFSFKTPEARSYQGSPVCSLHYLKRDSTSARSPSVINTPEDDSSENESEEDTTRGSRNSDCDSIDDSSADLDQSSLVFPDEKSEPEANEVEEVTDATRFFSCSSIVNEFMCAEGSPGISRSPDELQDDVFSDSEALSPPCWSSTKKTIEIPERCRDNPNFCRKI